jgi:pimeloyl-ACP methyl ester carboxylesterase
VQRKTDKHRSLMRLFTVHGVGEPAGWQAQVQEVLQFYFECVPISYPQFQSWPVAAVLRVVIAPFALVIAIAIPLLLWIGRFSNLDYRLSARIVGWAFWGAAIASIVMGLIVAFVRRQRAAAEVQLQIENHTTGGAAAHLIAHSLGTYLTCRTIKKVQGLRLKRIVYVGSVVHRNFSWDLFTGRRVEAVRNEVGGRDLVVFLAGIAKWLFCLWDLGWAGWKGFLGSAVVVHTCPDAELPCAQCTVQPQSAPLHNTVCPYDKHNTLFLSSFHAARFWLPFLWEYDPGYFIRFLARCQDLDQSLQGTAEFLDSFDRLRYASFGGRFCFEEMVVRELRAKHGLPLISSPKAEEVTDVLIRAWGHIVRAQDAMGKIARDRKPRIGPHAALPPTAGEQRVVLQCYDPRAAVARAIVEVCATKS